MFTLLKIYSLGETGENDLGQFFFMCLSTAENLITYWLFKDIYLVENRVWNAGNVFGNIFLNL